MTSADREDEAITWASELIPGSTAGGLCKAFWIESRGQFDAAVVLSGFTRRNVDIHVALRQGGLSRNTVIILFNSVFDYVFNTLGAARTTGLIRLSNQPARRFAEHLGFELEGVLREAFDDDDLCVYGFLQRDYEAHKWFRHPKTP